MKNKKLTLIILTSAIATGITIYLIRKNQARKRSMHIANEGYETAEDVLYPLASKRRKIRYY